MSLSDNDVENIKNVILKKLSDNDELKALPVEYKVELSQESVQAIGDIRKDLNQLSSTQLVSVLNEIKKIQTTIDDVPKLLETKVKDQVSDVFNQLDTFIKDETKEIAKNLDQKNNNLQGKHNKLESKYNELESKQSKISENLSTEVRGQLDQFTENLTTEIKDRLSTINYNIVAPKAKILSSLNIEEELTEKLETQIHQAIQQATKNTINTSTSESETLIRSLVNKIIAEVSARSDEITITPSLNQQPESALSLNSPQSDLSLNPQSDFLEQEKPPALDKEVIDDIANAVVENLHGKTDDQVLHSLKEIGEKVDTCNQKIGEDTEDTEKADKFFKEWQIVKILALLMLFVLFVLNCVILYKVVKQTQTPQTQTPQTQTPQTQTPQTQTPQTQTPQTQTPQTQTPQTQTPQTQTPQTQTPQTQTPQTMTLKGALQSYDKIKNGKVFCEKEPLACKTIMDSTEFREYYTNHKNSGFIRFNPFYDIYKTNPSISVCPENLKNLKNLKNIENIENIENVNFYDKDGCFNQLASYTSSFINTRKIQNLLTNQE